MKKLKNSHKGRVVRISHKGRVLCEFRTREMCCANFAQCTIHPCKCEIVVVSNGNNSWFLRVGNAS